METALTITSTIRKARMTDSTTSIPAVAFVGKQNSGKTTLLVQLIAELTGRGIKVGSVKHHSHVGFDFDIEGKDSWRHRRAGSAYTVVASPDQVACVQSLSAELELMTIIDMMTENTAKAGTTLDMILVEGYRLGGLPTVELFRSGNPKDESRDLGGEGNEIVAVITDIPRVTDRAQAQGLPVFDFKDIARIADYLIETRLPEA